MHNQLTKLWQQTSSYEETPSGEVLAVNKQNEFIVGYLTITDDYSFICEADDQILEDVIFFIPVGKLIKSLPKTVG